MFPPLSPYKRGLPPADLWVRAGNKSHQKTALQGPHLSTNHDNLDIYNYIYNIYYLADELEGLPPGRGLIFPEGKIDNFDIYDIYNIYYLADELEGLPPERGPSFSEGKFLDPGTRLGGFKYLGFFGDAGSRVQPVQHRPKKMG